MKTGTESLWQASAATASLPTLDHDLRVDVAVVGGGITGLTLAALLSEAGRRVAVLERNRIGSGTTGRTTAHLTASLDVSFGTLVSRFGEENARTVVGSSMRSIDEIERRVSLSGRDCGFRRVAGYRFSESADQAEPLDREAELARSLGLDAERVDDVPLPFPCADALRFDRQARIHPLAYLQVLADLALAAGAAIFEHAPVVEISDEGAALAHGPRVAADFVVDASHTPVGVVPSIQTRVAAFTSYVLAARLRSPVADALFWDMDDPYHYVRSAGEKGDSILVGGEDHRSGREADPSARLGALEEWTRRRFPVSAVEAQWSHELFEPADGLPYIGALPGSRRRFVAAGFSGTGLTFGTVGASLLCDLLTKGASPWEAVYSPARLKPLAAARPLIEENLRIGWRFLADRVTGGRTPEAELPPHSGRVERIGARQVAVYRDLRGDLHRLSARCTHLGCIVAWNDLEKTWDCPCHGGRFHPTGKPLYGPPTAGLEHEASAEAESSDERRAQAPE